MTKRNVCIDSVYPKDAMRVLVSDGAGVDIVMHMDKDAFEFLFGIEAKEGLYLEVDIEDVTKERRKKIRGLQKKLGLNA